MAYSAWSLNHRNGVIFCIGLSLLPSASRFFLASLHHLEQGVEILEPGLPELPVAFQPSTGLGEGLGLEPAGAALRIAAARNQAGALQDFEVLGDGRLTHRERLG